jgi:thymidylate kinase
MLIFVTGVAGSGKSTLCACLSDAGLEAHDADRAISRHVRAADGAVVATPPRHEQTPEWAAAHEFRFDMARVGEIAAEAAAREPSVILGAAYGDDEVIAIADLSFYLHLEEPELRRRLAARPPEQYGHHPHELESILAWHSAATGRYERLGARRLDASRPVDSLAREILGFTATGNSHARQRLP